MQVTINIHKTVYTNVDTCCKLCSPEQGAQVRAGGRGGPEVGAEEVDPVLRQRHRRPLHHLTQRLQSGSRGG